MKTIKDIKDTLPDDDFGRAMKELVDSCVDACIVEDTQWQTRRDLKKVYLNK